MSGVEEVEAFVLHSRPFKESSTILQVFSLQFGRLSVVANGIKRQKAQSLRATLQPFQLLRLGIAGKRDLKTLNGCELVTPALFSTFQFQGKRLACAFYASELIIRALPEQQEFPQVFKDYYELLSRLLLDDNFATHLRSFELGLLHAVGVLPDLGHDVDGRDIEPDRNYDLAVDKGFILQSATTSQIEQTSDYYSGAAIIALAERKIPSQYASQARQICRKLLQEIIGHKPLQSKKMWQHTT